MDGSSTRLAVGGVLGVVAMCVVGMVALSIHGKDGTALAVLAGTGLGIIGTLLLPPGGRPASNSPGPVVTVPAQVSPGIVPPAPVAHVGPN